MMIKRLFFIVLLLFLYVRGYSCKCPLMDIRNEVDNAYDIVVAHVTDEKMDTLACRSDWDFDHSFTVQVEFSYKNQLRGSKKIFAGKGGGSCGAILSKGVAYLLVVYKCEDSLYAYKCSDHSYLSHAVTRVNFLNGLF